ncbi:trigger factor [Lachnospiraceae bacterium YSD2013]|nr:trigger factor [Lachnospiraceae bacterium YSD2013]
MSLKVEKLENSMAKLTIEVSAEELDKAIEKAYHKNKNKIAIPGFRKGKAPRAIIEKMYGKEVFYEDAANEIIPDAYDKAYDECEEDIVSAPEVDVVQLEAGKPFIFTATVALKPEIKLGKYKGVKVAKADTTVSDDEVMAVIEKERENSARSISVERPVKDKDEVILDFEGFVDGVAFEGGKGENYPLTIGSGSFIPGFEEQLVGAEIGKEVTVKVTFPEDYHAEDLKGKAAEFKCTIKEVKEKELPELDDEFAAEVSEYDTFKEYKEATIKSLQDKKLDEAKNKKEDEAIEAIIAASEIEIPAPMLDTKKRQMVQDFAQNLKQSGLNMEQYFQFTGLTAEKLLEQVEPQAVKSIKSRLVLENIVKAEKIEASEEDFEKELNRIAEAYKMEVDKVKEMIDDNAKKQILEDLAVQKAVEFVVSNAKEA